MILINRSLAHVDTVALKVFHGLIRVKRFVSRFPTKLCNQFFYLYLMLYTCIVRLDVTFQFENFWNDLTAGVETRGRIRRTITIKPLPVSIYLLYKTNSFYILFHPSKRPLSRSSQHGIESRFWQLQLHHHAPTYQDTVTCMHLGVASMGWLLIRPSVLPSL